MKKFTQWLSEFVGPSGSSAQQIDAQVSLTGNQLTVATTKGTVMLTLQPQEALKFTQQVQMKNAGLNANMSQVPAQGNQTMTTGS